MIAAKIRNSRTLLSRKGMSGTEVLRDLGVRAGNADSKDELRGAEGEAAERYFARLDETLVDGWTFAKRTKRPPEDHINSLLSLTYVMIKKRDARGAASVQPRSVSGNPPRRSPQPPLARARSPGGTAPDLL